MELWVDLGSTCSELFQRPSISLLALVCLLECQVLDFHVEAVFACAVEAVPSQEAVAVPFHVE